MTVQSRDGRDKAADSERPTPEVPEEARRRSFVAAYKLRILKEADACVKPGQLGELLRREGLYSSHLRTWREPRDGGVLAGLTPRRRGRKANPRDPMADEVERLRRENERLSQRPREPVSL